MYFNKRNYSIDAILQRIEKIRKGEITRYGDFLEYGSKKTADRISVRLKEKGFNSTVNKFKSREGRYFYRLTIKNLTND